jgi:GTP pyrophosphokinase
MADQVEYFSDKYKSALKYVFDLHRDQYRKGSQKPYLSHLLAVSALVMENGGTEIEAISALLHDAVEDQGGLETLAEIRRLFGEEVASIVEACSDSMITPKPPWCNRKEAYLKKLEGASPSVILVSQADKLHNLRSILQDYRERGEELWDKFRGGKDGSLWYYHQLIKVYQKHGSNPILTELEKTMHELDFLVESQPSEE